MHSGNTEQLYTILRVMTRKNRNERTQ